LNKKTDVRSALLLSATSTDELTRFTEKLMIEPDSICGGSSKHCTALPEACTASLEIEAVVNRVHRSVLWGSGLADIAEHHRHVELFRPYMGGLAPVEIDPRDREALRLPLLPGDQIKVR
jgi:hypothetical protein